jgi:hypothetical protein
MDGDLMRNLIHLHDILALHVHGPREAEVPLEGTRQVVVLDMLCGANQRVHKNEKVVGAVMPFLMVKKKIHESFFKCDAEMLLASLHYISSFSLPKAPAASEERMSLIVAGPSRVSEKERRISPGRLYLLYHSERKKYRKFCSEGRKKQGCKGLLLLKKVKMSQVWAVAAALSHTGFDDLAVFEDHEEVAFVPERKAWIAATVFIPIEGIGRPFLPDGFGAVAIAHNGVDFSGGHAALDPLQVRETGGARYQQENQRNQHKLFGQAHPHVDPPC